MTNEPEITINSKVTVKINGEHKNLQIVGSADIDPKNGRISFLSQLGEKMLGKKNNDEFEMTLPNGKKMVCQILNIEN